jgi:AraC-like DNA-binding protein
MKLHHACLAAVLITLAALLSPLPAASQVLSSTAVTSINEHTSLAGPWKIMIGDNVTYAAADYNDSSWDTVDLPGSMMPYVMEKADSIGKTRGVLWLRKTIDAGRDLPKEDLGLILGRIGNADETYFNGSRIGGMGEFPPREHSMWNHPRYYRVSWPMVRYGGDNVIAIRVSYYIFGEMLGELAVTNTRDLEAARVAGRFLFIDLSYIAIAMGITMLFLTLFFYLRRTASQEYLFYLLQLLCGGIMILELCTYWNVYGSLLTRFKVLGIGWAAVNVAHPIFLHRIYDLRRKKIEIALWIYLAVTTFITLFFIDDANLRAGGIAMILVTYLIGPYNISCHLSALYKKHPFAKQMSFFGIILVLAALHDGALYLLKFIGYDLSRVGTAMQVMLFQYASAGLYIGTALVLVARFARIMNEVEDLNTSLENFVIENALLNKRLTDSAAPSKRGPYPVISDRADEKIQQVMSYIQENYTFDISREGLAATVDVHPDSLGKLFKSFAGKKLGDYINELRVRDAAQKLTETDDSVISIAFSAGFDSLRTFNRVFPKFMNTTPEKYRNEFKK